MAKSVAVGGPYTVKKSGGLKSELSYKWLYTCPNNSPLTLVLAIGANGVVKRYHLLSMVTFGFFPYTDLEEANTNCLISFFAVPHFQHILCAGSIYFLLGNGGP